MITRRKFTTTPATISLRLDPVLLAALDEIAYQKRTSRAMLIDCVLRDVIEHPERWDLWQPEDEGI